MRLIARIDDRTLQRCLKPHLLFEKIRTLTDLKGNFLGRESDLATDFPSAAEDLASDEVRGYFSNDSTKRKCTIDKVILVTSIRVSLAIRVVLVNHNRLAIG